MFDERRYLGTFAVLSLVLLRLVIGWHFFGEGTKKLEYDRHDQEVRLAFSSEGFLAQAKGPLAPLYQRQVRGEHDWRKLLAVPKQNVPPTEAEAVEHAKWMDDYTQRQKAAAKEGEPLLIEFPPFLAYHEWATQVRDDWREVLDEVKSVEGLSEEQKQRANEAYVARVQQMADYLADEGDAIANYRHDLWRLENWRASPEAGEVPFVGERIALKTVETNGKASAWVREIQKIETQYFDDLRRLLDTGDAAGPKTATAVSDAIQSASGDTASWIDVAVTVLTISVGVCLLLGFLTRVASFAGAIFLVSVIASQPPWISDAAPTMPQVIELAGLLVLAATGAGRWLGIDYFFYALFNRNRRSDVEA